MQLRTYLLAILCFVGAISAGASREPSALEREIWSWPATGPSRLQVVTDPSVPERLWKRLTSFQSDTDPRLAALRAITYQRFFRNQADELIHHIEHHWREGNSPRRIGATKWGTGNVLWVSGGRLASQPIQWVEFFEFGPSGELLAWVQDSEPGTKTAARRVCQTPVNPGTVPLTSLLAVGQTKPIGDLLTSEEARAIDDFTVALANGDWPAASAYLALPPAAASAWWQREVISRASPTQSQYRRAGTTGILLDRWTWALTLEDSSHVRLTYAERLARPFPPLHFQLVPGQVPQVVQILN